MRLRPRAIAAVGGDGGGGVEEEMRRNARAFSSLSPPSSRSHSPRRAHFAQAVVQESKVQRPQERLPLRYYFTK